MKHLLHQRKLKQAELNPWFEKGLSRHFSYALVFVLLAFYGSPAIYAQLTTWEEDMSKAKALEEQHDFVEAERIYRQALGNLPEDPAEIGRASCRERV